MTRLFRRWWLRIREFFVSFHRAKKAVRSAATGTRPPRTINVDAMAVRGVLLERGLTPLQLRARLYSRDHTVASWARSRGYEAGTVQRVMYRWAGHRGLPRGRLTRAILRDLSLDLGISIPPGIDWAAADAVAVQGGTDSPRRRVAGTLED